VPLFIEELTKSVVESGILTETGDAYTASGSVTALTIPTTLHGSLLARLDRLAPTREVAQIAAALGRQFSHELISAVASMAHHELDDALEQLVRAELIFRRGTPPNAEYTFKHALVQDAAYSTLLRSRRQQIHAQIAATLETKFPHVVSSQPALLAQHCAEAGLTDKAIGYSLKAGQQAVAHSAMMEAVAQLQKGLDLLAGIPETSSRDEQEMDLRMALGPALNATRGYSATEVGETIARSRVLAERLHRTDHLLPLQYGQWQFHIVRAEYRVALSIAEQIETFANLQSDIPVISQGQFMRGMTSFYLGEFDLARSLFERCDRLRDAAHAALMAEDPYPVMLGYLALSLTILGYIDEGRNRINEALTAARQLKYVNILAFVLSMACWVKWAANLPYEGVRYAKELLSLSSEHGFPHWLSWGMLHRGWQLTELGQPHEGLSLLAKGLAMRRTTGAISCTPWVLQMHTKAYAKLGRSAEGQHCLAEAAKLVANTNEHFCEAELHRLRGDLLVVSGDQVAAEASYNEAITVAQRQHARIFGLRAAARLACIRRDQGRPIEARDLLSPFYEWFPAGLDTPDLKAAQALLDSLR
jgi:tetratricopeptide (TPR) repeat protein